MCGDRYSSNLSECPHCGEPMTGEPLVDRSKLTMPEIVLISLAVSSLSIPWAISIANALISSR